MPEDKLPEFQRSRPRRAESRWERFWRRRRMKAVRNSSDHATFLALAILFLLCVLVAVVIVAVKYGGFPSPGTGSGMNMARPPGR